MLRVIGVLIFALILLGLAGHLFYKNKSRDETSHIQPQWQYHLAVSDIKSRACGSGAYW